MKSIYSKEILEKVVKNCTTYADALIALGRKPRGSNYETIKKYIKKYNLDVSHFDEGLSKIKKSNRKRVKTEDVLNNVYYIGSDNLKKRLINENLKEYKCEKCGNNEWNNQPIPLELHHINGNSYDNRLENLQLLCPNCHAQTNNYRGKNSSNKDEKYTITRRFIANIEEKTCLNCGKTFLPERKTRKFCCRQCYDEYMSKNNENIIIKDDNIEINNINRIIKDFYLFVGIIAEHSITIDDNEIMLKSLFKPQTNINIKYRNVSLIELIKNMIRGRK